MQEIKKGRTFLCIRGKGRTKTMNEKNNAIYKIKKLKMPVSISSISKNNGRNLQLFNPDSLFLLTMQQDMRISNEIGKNLKTYNIFDLGCLHREPDKAAFDMMIPFSFLYKSELGNLEEVAADNATASFVCGEKSDGFFKRLNESGYSIARCGSGIYRANVLLVDIYIIVVSELGDTECRWMESLIMQADGKCPEICINGLKCSFGIAEY